MNTKFKVIGLTRLGIKSKSLQLGRLRAITSLMQSITITPNHLITITKNFIVIGYNYNYINSNYNYNFDYFWLVIAQMAEWYGASVS